MSEPPAYAEVGPAFKIPANRHHRLRPLHQWPHDGLGRVFMLAWQADGAWRGMWGRYDDVTGRFVADAVLHRTSVLERTPTHFVDDRR